MRDPFEIDICEKNAQEKLKRRRKKGYYYLHENSAITIIREGIFELAKVKIK